jgi:2-polyprenyl-3-methyl-5-hydroxy-6-metoxy-1,4-benzoquinol methylase
MPWRKGPFDFFGTHIDTEWRSDWKWHRIAPWLSDLDGRKVLEFGAADGRTLLEMWTLLDGYGEYDGVEYAQELIDEAPVLPPNVALFEGDVHELPENITAKTYDMVTALAVLEHVEDPELVVRNAFELLEEGGIFVASSPAPFWDDIAGNLKLVEDDFHTVEVTTERLEDWARKAGFSFVTSEPFMWVATGSLAYAGLGPDPATSLKIDRLLSKLPFTNKMFVNQLLIARR